MELIIGGIILFCTKEMVKMPETETETIIPFKS